MFDDVIGTIDVEKTANDGREASRIDFLYVDLNVLLEVIAIQIEHEVMYEVEPVTDDYQRELIREFGFLESVRGEGRVRKQRLMQTDEIAGTMITVFV